MPEFVLATNFERLMADMIRMCLMVELICVVAAGTCIDTLNVFKVNYIDSI